MQSHWNKVYEKSDQNKLGWYEETPNKCLALVEKCNLSKEDLIADIGTGTSNFLDNLIANGYTNLLALDISDSALKKKKKLLQEKGISTDIITWFTGDIQDKQIFRGNNGLKIKLWHDRAVLHFLLTEEGQRAYKENLLTNLEVEGFVILAVFAKDGAKKCSGLDLTNYSKEDLEKFLGNDFELLESFNYTYVQPSGNPRPFVYTLFKRKG
jgi:hypothetical protein